MHCRLPATHHATCPVALSTSDIRDKILMLNGVATLPAAFVVAIGRNTGSKTNARTRQNPDIAIPGKESRKVVNIRLTGTQSCLVSYWSDVCHEQRERRINLR